MNEKVVEMFKIDFHVHSNLSYDCDTDLEEIANKCKENNLDAVVVADHNETILNVMEINGVTLIPAEEIFTRDGEIIGIFLSQKIEPFLSLSETVIRIKEQNGIVYVPHPVDFYRKGGIGLKKLNEIIEYVDIIEVMNYKTLTKLENFISRKIASKFNRRFGAGSDAHKVEDVGKCYIEFDTDNKQKVDSPYRLLELFNYPYFVKGTNRGLLKAINLKVRKMLNT